ncbi:ABC transporter ATP-binding protein [Agromyces allii]|uniref:ATP-binding cassette domain-containing protein n=1 Tax=Agromyces allii TaxID=393607 RepID=A0ABN2QKK2_9MICO|nr:ATP-binding cassette domain-containing protein [Agromyces allii]
MRIELAAIGHQFADQWLFQGLSLTFEADRLYALVGPSGSGKSTLLSIIASMISPTEGSITFERVDEVFWVFQTANGVPARSAADHVALPLLAQGMDRTVADPIAHDILHRFGLGATADRPFKSLSGGEAQRLMLARAMARDPQCLLIDEPTAQLDRTSAASVTTTLINLRSSSRITIVATHDQSVIDACDSVIDLTPQT